MSDSNESDQHLLEFARQVAAIPRRISEDHFGIAQRSTDNPSIAERATTATLPSPEPNKIPPVEPAATPIDLQPRINKNPRTAQVLAHMILTALQEQSEYPGQGFLITVYGSNPWNAMLTIRPEAGPRIDRGLWLARVQDITAQLRKEFDVTHETHPS
jgi:hypothetical protein